jgi:hypothetical protein
MVSSYVGLGTLFFTREIHVMYKIYRIFKPLTINTIQSFDTLLL